MSKTPTETPTARYLASFRQPLGHMNPLGLRFAAPIDVELYAAGKTPVRWKAQTVAENQRPRPILWPQAKGQMEYPESSGGIAMLKAAVSKLFEEQLTPWREFTPGKI